MLSHRLKLSRAVEHLYALKAVTERWQQGEPCGIRHYCETQSRKHIFAMEVRSQPADPVIPFLIGDCIHNARHALDHLAYGLAVRVGGDPPGNEETSQFPIRKPSSFDGALANDIGPKKAMPKGLYAALEGLQPYHGGGLEVLGALDRLDKLDKHRFPPVVAGVGEVPSFHIGQLSVSYMQGPRVGAVKDGAPILEYVPQPGTDMNMDFEFIPAIAFDERSPVAAGQSVAPFLDSILSVISARVFPTLEPFL